MAGSHPRPNPTLPHNTLPATLTYSTYCYHIYHVGQLNLWTSERIPVWYPVGITSSWISLIRLQSLSGNVTTSNQTQPHPLHNPTQPHPAQYHLT